MRQEAERNPATLVLSLGVVCRFLFFLFIIGFGIAPQQARCDRGRNQRRATKRDCGNDAVHSAYRDVQKQNWQPQNRVANHAAKSGGQRPMRAARQASGKGRSQHRAKRPHYDAQPLTPAETVSEQPITPGCNRQDQRQRAEAEKLHHQVGDNRAGPAEQVVHRHIGGVAERRVAHRPARERQRAHHGETDEKDSA